MITKVIVACHSSGSILVTLVNIAGQEFSFDDMCDGTLEQMLLATVSQYAGSAEPEWCRHGEWEIATYTI